MFAVLAAISFLLALFNVDLGDLTAPKLVTLGLLCMALALLFPWSFPFSGISVNRVRKDET